MTWPGVWAIDQPLRAVLSDSMKRLPAVLMLLASACTAAPIPSTVTLAPSTSPTTSSTTTTTVTTTLPQPSTTLLPTGIEALPESLQAEIIQLVEDVQRLRELPFLEAPRVTVLTADELASRVREQIAEETENVDADQALYVLLGLLPSGQDLLGLYTDLYGEQIAGFYDGDAKELVVPAGEATFSPLERGTLIHELTHALTDQHHQLWQKRNQLIDDQKYDEATAFLSVIEGDATLVQIRYLQEMSPEDQQAFLAASFQTDTTVFDAAPLFIQRSLLFPYQEGLVFTQRLFDLGGFGAVDDAYDRWPTSTEQIITPREYLRDEPLTPSTAEITIPGNELVYDSDWGELSFLLMFEQVLGEGPVASDPSQGWGGDRFRLWFDGENVTMVIEYVGDTSNDAGELFDALNAYVASAMSVGKPNRAGDATTFSGADYAFVDRSGANVVFVAAGDPAVGAAVVAELGG